MKKIAALVFVLSFSVVPASTYAAVNSINGLTALDQLLVTPGSNATNTMHMEIVEVGADKHRFRWDGSPWRVDQGGTGLSASPLFGQLLVGDGLGGYSLVATSSLGISAVPAGSEGQVQFIHDGHFEGSDEFTYDIGNRLTLTTLLYAEDVDISGKLSYDNGNPGESWISLASARKWLFSDAADLGGVLDFSNIVSETKTFIFPNFSGTFGLLEANQVWSGENAFSKGASATTTVSFGEVGDVTSRSCFNTKNTDGQDISFYFVGTTMVVESNLCQ